MIQIDDSGSGSFVGGTCIGFYRPETNDYYFDIIPVELYSVENFKKKIYLDYVVEFAGEALRALGASKSEPVEVCRGYMFDKLKPWLNDMGYCWYETQISGKAQEVVENNYTAYAVRLGLPEQYIKYTRYPFHFHKLLRWVFADFNERIDLCKVGWKCWQQIRGIVPEVEEGIMNSANYYCLKCGKHIRMGGRIKILRYVSNKENYVYIHDNCDYD